MLIVLYFGLAKTLSPSELGVQYLQNEKSFHKIIKSNQATVILIDAHQTGFLMKTHYLKFRVISGYDNVDELIVRTNREFFRKNQAFIGLSIYRRHDDSEEFTPIPPGSLHIGNPEFGEWKVAKNGRLVWKFNKPLKNLPRYLGWGDFMPDMDFFQQLKVKQSLGEAYYGPNNQFGTNGFITKNEFPQFFKEERLKKVEMKTLLMEYFKENF